MSSVDDLVTWLRAQLDEDERVAREATDGPWRVNNEDYAETIYSADDSAVVAGGRWGGEASVFNDTADALHIALHDPARVLRGVEAKRQLVSLHAEPHECPAWDAAVSEVYTGYFGGSEPCPVMRLLAQEYGREEPPRPAV